MTTERAQDDAAPEPTEPPTAKPVSLTIYLPSALRRAAKVRAAQSGVTMSALLTRLLNEHLEREAAE